MSTERNKALYRRWLQELWQDANLAVIDELYSPDYIDRTPMPGLPPGLDGERAIVSTLHTAFPNWTFTLEHVLAEGDLVAGRWRMEATQTGPIAFLGLPATGKRIAMSGTEIMRIVDGKIVECWHMEDVAGLIQQLGAPPAPAAVGAA